MTDRALGWATIVSLVVHGLGLMAVSSLGAGTPAERPPIAVELVTVAPPPPAEPVEPAPAPKVAPEKVVPPRVEPLPPPAPRAPEPVAASVESPPPPPFMADSRPAPMPDRAAPAAPSAPAIAESAAARPAGSAPRPSAGGPLFSAPSLDAPATWSPGPGPRASFVPSGVEVPLGTPSAGSGGPVRSGSSRSASSAGGDGLLPTGTGGPSGNQSTSAAVGTPDPEAQGSPSSSPRLAMLPPTGTAGLTSFVRPLGGYQKTPAYPEAARRLGVEGVTQLRFEVLASGKVGRMLIERSSGNDALDQAAIEAVKTWQFDPARRGREAVTVWVSIPVRFSLDSR